MKKPPFWSRPAVLIFISGSQIIFTIYRFYTQDDVISDHYFNMAIGLGLVLLHKFEISKNMDNYVYLAVSNDSKEVKLKKVGKIVTLEIFILILVSFINRSIMAFVFAFSIIALPEYKERYAKIVEKLKESNEDGKEPVQG